MHEDDRCWRPQRGSEAPAECSAPEGHLHWLWKSYRWLNDCSFCVHSLRDRGCRDCTNDTMLTETGVKMCSDTTLHIQNVATNCSSAKQEKEITCRSRHCLPARQTSRNNTWPGSDFCPPGGRGGSESPTLAALKG